MKIPFTDIVDSIMLTADDPDSYLHGISRELVIKHGIRSIEDLRYSGDKVFKEAEGEMNRIGKFRMPVDFVDYVAIYFVVDGYLVPALRNDSINTWYSYMMDNDDIVAAQNITDNEGNKILDNMDYDIIKADDLNGMYSKYCTLKLKNNDFIYGKHGYKFDYRDNTLTFDDIPEGYHRILIQYIANVDLTDFDKIEIHPYFQKYLEDEIYWRIIEKKRNVPMNEKIRAKQQKVRSHKDAMFELNFKVKEFIQALMS
jgi:hypothetical protein|nr:MAG TPA: Structural protein [Crassvirales sp.]